MGRPQLITKLTAFRCFLSGFETYCITPTAWKYIKSLDQTRFFLALVLCAYNFGAIVATPLFGLITDRVGNPRLIYLCSCVVKVVGYMMYSINTSGYFPLFGRLLCGLSGVGSGVLLGQIALQTDKETRAKSFVFIESGYCLGSAFGPGIGGFITFHTTILGWEINDGNSPGIVLTVIWLLFLILSLFLPNDIWVETGARSGKQRRTIKSIPKTELSAILCDSRIICLLFLVFCSEAFSSTSTFYVPILALDHFHLQLIHSKLLFLNCTLFTLVVFICLFLASEYIEERNLVFLALIMQIIAISSLTGLAFAWDQITSVQHYILIIYICFGMPYFMYPIANSLLSKVTDPRYATFVQGLSYAALHSAIVISRVAVSFAFTKTSLLCYSLGMVVLWLASLIWYGVLFKKMVPND